MATNPEAAAVADDDQLGQMEEQIRVLQGWLNDPLFLLDRAAYLLRHPAQSDDIPSP